MGQLSPFAAFSTLEEDVEIADYLKAAALEQHQEPVEPVKHLLPDLLAGLQISIQRWSVINQTPCFLDRKPISPQHFLQLLNEDNRDLEVHIYPNTSKRILLWSKPAESFPPCCSEGQQKCSSSSGCSSCRTTSTPNPFQGPVSCKEIALSRLAYQLELLAPCAAKNAAIAADCAGVIMTMLQGRKSALVQHKNRTEAEVVAKTRRRAAKVQDAAKATAAMLAEAQLRVLVCSTRMPDLPEDSILLLRNQMKAIAGLTFCTTTSSSSSSSRSSKGTGSTPGPSTDSPSTAKAPPGAADAPEAAPPRPGSHEWLKEQLQDVCSAALATSVTARLIKSMHAAVISLAGPLATPLPRLSRKAPSSSTWATWKPEDPKARTAAKAAAAAAAAAAAEAAAAEHAATEKLHAAVDALAAAGAAWRLPKLDWLCWKLAEASVSEEATAAKASRAISKLSRACRRPAAHRAAGARLGDQAADRSKAAVAAAAAFAAARSRARSAAAALKLPEIQDKLSRLRKRVNQQTATGGRAATQAAATDEQPAAAPGQAGASASLMSTVAQKLAGKLHWRPAAAAAAAAAAGTGQDRRRPPASCQGWQRQPHQQQRRPRLLRLQRQRRPWWQQQSQSQH